MNQHLNDIASHLFQYDKYDSTGAAYAGKHLLSEFPDKADIIRDEVLTAAILVNHGHYDDAKAQAYDNSFVGPNAIYKMVENLFINMLQDIGDDDPYVGGGN